MLLGIDVGGTFTDAVLISEQKIIAQAKIATTHENILQGILKALDTVLNNTPSLVTRVVISSTIVTNALTEGNLPSAFLGIVAGPGMNTDYKFPVKPQLFSGCIDHRGKVVTKLCPREWENLCGKGGAAVSVKFAVRNSEFENELGEALGKHGFDPVFCATKLNGELNFIRRTNSAYFAAVTYDLFYNFVKMVEKALRDRSIVAPIYILKADGGTIPLHQAVKQPLETVFTGPAASVLGIEALVAPDKPVISLDVGGTTTDIAFWDKGVPLMSKRGAVINGYPTTVRTFHMRSIGIGGDSTIIKNSDGSYKVGPCRAGRAMAVGGNVPTLGDALITAGLTKFGETEKARKAIEKFGNPLVESKKIVSQAVITIKTLIDEMLEDWAYQPVYMVEDVLRGMEFKPVALIGVGGGASGLIHALGEKMQLPVEVPIGGMVANAIGAALAKPTFSAGLRADTTEGYYLIPEEGQRRKLPSGFGKKYAEDILKHYLLTQTKDWQYADTETELISYEFFSTIHGYYSSGEIINMRMQLKPGILYRIHEVQDVEL